LLQGARHTLLRRILAAAQRFTDRAQVVLLKKSEQDRGAVLRSELVDRFVEDGRNLREVCRGVVLLYIHFDSLPFTELTTAIASHGFGGHKAGVTVQPSAQHDVFGKRASLACEVHEDGLSDVLRLMRVAIDQSYRRRINQIDVARDQFVEGRFRPVLHVISE